MHELPLVFFTVLSQMAAGGAVYLSFLDRAQKIKPDTGKFITGALVVLTALGMFISLFHLGHPWFAFRALANVGSSWLSREVLFFSIFLFLLIIYYFQWQNEQSGARRSLGLLITLVAIAAVVASGLLYSLPSMPAWNNFSPVLFFLFTAMLLGSIYVATIMALKEEESFRFLGATTLVIILYALGFGLYLFLLLSAGGGQYATGMEILGSSTFWLRAVLSWLIPLIFFVWVRNSGNNIRFGSLFTVLLVVVAGELLGRWLFYSTVVPLQVGAF